MSNVRKPSMLKCHMSQCVLKKNTKMDRLALVTLRELYSSTLSCLHDFISHDAQVVVLSFRR